MYAGIDGGQSSTTAIIADATGKILGVGHAGPADEVAQDAHSSRLHDAFHLAINHALRAANAFPDTAFAAVVAGLSGYNGAVIGRKPEVNSERFELVHDTRIAHAAAFGSGAGVIVVAGTGSVAFGINDQGEEARVGGHGYLFGDEGSAFWIGRRLIQRVMHDEDAALPSPISKPVLEYFKAGEIGEVSDAFYAGRIDRAALAALGKLASELAAQGIDDARFIIEQAADASAALAALCARRLYGNKRVLGREVPVAFTGGLMKNAAFAARAKDRLRDRLPEGRIVTAEYSPAAGALLLAYKARGLNPLPRIHD